MDTIAIIILNWNQPQLTISTIESIKKITHPKFNYHVYLLDNGSTDNSYEILNNKFSNDHSITLLKSKSNLGFVGGNNFVLNYIKQYNQDYYLLINNDVIVKPDFLSILHTYLKVNSNISLVGPKIYFAPGFEFHKNRYSKPDLGKIIWFAGGHIDWNNIYCSHIGIDQIDTGQFDKVIINPDYLTGCCLLFSRELLKKIKEFDSRYYLYLEDAELCQRAKLLGFNCGYIPKSVIWRINSGSSSAGGDLHNYFLTRNRLLFGFTYASLRTKFALFRDSIKILLTSPSFWQKRGVIDFYFNNFGKGSWK